MHEDIQAGGHTHYWLSGGRGSGKSSFASLEIIGGMLQDKRTLFIFMTVIMLTVVFYVLIKLPDEKKFVSWQIFLCLICAGGIGNMIDRVRFDYVVDFIYFVLIDFPVFNLADILITIGTVLFSL